MSIPSKAAAAAAGRSSCVFLRRQRAPGILYTSSRGFLCLSSSAPAPSAPARLPSPLPHRWQPFSRGMSAIPAGQQPTSAISTLNPETTAASAHMLREEHQVEVLWDDGHYSHHDYTWLRVNCPSFVHESGQRTVFPGDVDPELTPVEVCTSQSTMQELPRRSMRRMSACLCISIYFVHFCRVSFFRR